MTQPKTDLAYLRSEKAKAEQKLRSCQHREKILERQMSELNRRERVHRLCTRAGMLESFLVCPGELTDDQVMELLKISFRQPEVVLALAKMVHDVHEDLIALQKQHITRNFNYFRSDSDILSLRHRFRRSTWIQVFSVMCSR